MYLFLCISKRLTVANWFEDDFVGKIDLSGQTREKNFVVVQEQAVNESGATQDADFGNYRDTQRVAFRVALIADRVENRFVVISLVWVYAARETEECHRFHPKILTA